MGMTVTVLGCDASYPSPGGACSGYLLQSGSTALWMDAGSGTMAQLAKQVDIDRLDGIVISHAHPDHWTDLLVYHHLVRYHRERSVPVYAPRRVLELMEAVNGEVLPLDWHVIDETSTAKVGGIALRFSRTDHPPETLAVRVDGEGRSMAYTADTGPAWSMAGAFGDGVDVALCEATYLADREGTAGHLSGRQAGALARAAGARRLVLTHLWPVIDPQAVRAEAEGAYGGPVDLARMHETYEV